MGRLDENEEPVKSGSRMNRLFLPLGVGKNYVIVRYERGDEREEFKLPLSPYLNAFFLGEELYSIRRRLSENGITPEEDCSE